jgi:hypothetical protein
MEKEKGKEEKANRKFELSRLGGLSRDVAGYGHYCLSLWLPMYFSMY